MRKTILASLLLAPTLAAASGYSLPNAHPRDLAVCASGVAAQDDAAATFALPAALARLNGPSIRIGGGAVNVKTDWTDPTPGATQPPYVLNPAPPPAVIPGPAEPGKASLATQWTYIPAIALAYGGKLPGTERGWGVGLSIQPFGGSIVKWPDDWAGRYRITRVDREVFSGVLGAGVEIIPQVRLGGGIVYYYTKEKFTQKLWQQEFNPPASFAAPDATATLDLTGGAFTYDASIEIEATKNLNFAIDYKHKATQDLTGSVSWSGVAAATAANPIAAGAVTATSAYQTLTIPNTLNVGAAFRPVKPVLITGTFTFDRWVVYDADTFYGNTGFTINVPRHYGNGQTYRAGVAWDVMPLLTVRAGAQRDVSGLNRQFYSPTLPDASSWGGSLGATVRFAKAFSFDVAGFYAKMDKVTAAPPAGSSEPSLTGGPAATGGAIPLPVGTFRGSYQPSAFVFTASVNWQPGASM